MAKKSKSTFKIWLVIEECVNAGTDDEQFIDHSENQQSAGIFDSMDEATEQFNEIVKNYGGDFTK